MRTFQFDLYKAIVWKGAKNQWSGTPCKMYETREESERENVKRRWLPRGFKIIAEQNI